MNTKQIEGIKLCEPPKKYWKHPLHILRRPDGGICYIQWKRRRWLFYIGMDPIDRTTPEKATEFGYVWIGLRHKPVLPQTDWKDEILL